MQSSPARFPTTRWTLIDRVRGGNETTRGQALGDLCQAYWFPLYVFARRTGLEPHDAEDAVQGFFLEVLKNGLFARADGERGRLRTLLCTALHRHLQQLNRNRQSLRRGGGAEHLPLLPEDAEQRYRNLAAKDPSPAEELFQRQWAHSVIDRASAMLELYYEKRGKGAQFAGMETFLPWNGGDESHEETARKLGMTLSAFRSALFRMRRRLRKYIILEIRQTIESGDPDRIEAEIKDLLRALLP